MKTEEITTESLKKENENFPITLTENAQKFLLKQADLEGLGRQTARFSLIFGKNREGKGVFKYNVETVTSPDFVTTLDNGSPPIVMVEYLF